MRLTIFFSMVVAKKCEVEPVKQYVHSTCAVVSSSGSLKEGSRGREIDAHEAIFRFNDAPTAKYTKHVGTRTTYRILNHACTTVLATGHKVYETGTRMRLCSKLTKGELAGVSLITSNPEVVSCNPRVLRSAGPGNYKSFERSKCHARTAMLTGTRGVLTALFMCRNVTLYGFNMSENQHFNYHYYDSVVLAKNRHSPTCDQRYIDDLVKSHRPITYAAAIDVRASYSKQHWWAKKTPHHKKPPSNSTTKKKTPKKPQNHTAHRSTATRKRVRVKRTNHTTHTKSHVVEESTSAPTLLR